MRISLAPDDAWEPLPPEQWNADSARHLLRRAGWSARPEQVDRAVQQGLGATLDRLFPAALARLPKPEAIATIEREAPTYIRELKGKTGDERRQLQREVRERARVAVQEMALAWLRFAADPANAASAKWTLFLSDVYVVSAQKVRNPAWMFEHFDLLARLGLGPAPALTQAVSRSPAMAVYLDLNQSRRDAPNENFARELFELFLLGEGHYTERDIKEAARAFTGYRVRAVDNAVRVIPRQHDASAKTIFGASGRFTGDDVIALAYRQPAAAAFLPHELVKFYLSDEPLPAEHLTALGHRWSQAGFDLRWLARQFFGSRLFFAPEFRGTFIKSPVSFYLGMVQDLGIDVAPLPRLTLNPLRQMGQWLFYPPNVRGWVGGTHWINAATLTARRLLVEMLFSPLNERVLNADEVADLNGARSRGAHAFVVGDAQLEPWSTLPSDVAVTRLCADLLATPPSPQLTETLLAFLRHGDAAPEHYRRRVHRAAAVLLQSPDYQLS